MGRKKKEGEREENKEGEKEGRNKLIKEEAKKV